MERLVDFFKVMFSLISLLGMFTQCMADHQERSLYDENFYYYVIDENNIAVGGLRTYPESGVVFFPEKFENYTVSRLGFSWGTTGTTGSFAQLSNEKDGKRIMIERCYFPHTIKEIKSPYISYSNEHLKIFYCGEVVDLTGFDESSRGGNIYVPTEKYELFKNTLSKYFSGNLLKANVSYYLNYDENNYYYIDYYENGEKIIYIPPIPQRDGYTFDGWFKEAECINQWDFETDTVQTSEEIEEVKLYAKWIAEK